VEVENGSNTVESTKLPYRPSWWLKMELK